MNLLKWIAAPLVLLLMIFIMLGVERWKRISSHL